MYLSNLYGIEGDMHLVIFPLYHILCYMPMEDKNIYTVSIILCVIFSIYLAMASQIGFENVLVLHGLHPQHQMPKRILFLFDIRGQTMIKTDLAGQWHSPGSKG